MKLVNLSMPTNMLFTLKADCYQVMDTKHLTISITILLFFVMLLLDFFGLRINWTLQKITLEAATEIHYLNVDN